MCCRPKRTTPVVPITLDGRVLNPGTKKGRVRIDCDLRAARLTEKLPMVKKGETEYMVNRAGDKCHVVHASGAIFKFWAKGGESFSGSWKYTRQQIDTRLKTVIKDLPASARP